jgi:hypothetical protein
MADILLLARRHRQLHMIDFENSHGSFFGCGECAAVGNVGSSHGHALPQRPIEDLVDRRLGGAAEQSQADRR